MTAKESLFKENAKPGY